MNTVAPNTFQGDVVIETHTGRLWSVIMLIALIIPAISVVLYPTGPARVALAAVGIVGVGVFAMAWSGFQYRFSSDGIEIRMLGLRLRSIPRSQILSYSVEPWAFIRGYGIRGIGNARAYVWSNKVVHIKTSTGDVFLGHNDPERIIRDLDQLMEVLNRG